MDENNEPVVDDNGEFVTYRKSPEPDILWLYILGACLLYPLAYDSRQAIKQGSEYLQDVWNYMDMMHLSLGYLNLVF